MTLVTALETELVTLEALDLAAGALLEIALDALDTALETWLWIELEALEAALRAAFDALLAALDALERALDTEFCTLVVLGVLGLPQPDSAIAVAIVSRTPIVRAGRREHAVESTRSEHLRKEGSRPLVLRVGEHLRGGRSRRRRRRP